MQFHTQIVTLLNTLLDKKLDYHVHFFSKSRATAVTQITYKLFTLLQNKKINITSHQLHPEKKQNMSQFGPHLIHSERKS